MPLCVPVWCAYSFTRVGFGSEAAGRLSQLEVEGRGVLFLGLMLKSFIADGRRQAGSAVLCEALWMLRQQ